MLHSHAHTMPASALTFTLANSTFALAAATASTLSASGIPHSALRIPQSPNIVFILADDMGYGDVSALNPGGKIPTPNIDRIARNGIVFTDAHSGSAVCSPTRYGILTGRYAWRTRLKEWVLAHYDKPLIPPSRTTMASMLRSNGYTTACIGKWHLGWDYPTTDGKPPRDKKDDYNLDFTRPIPDGPTAVGFDSYFGTDVPNYPPFCFIKNDRTVGVPSVWYPRNQKYIADAGHGIPDWSFEPILPALEEKAAQFIRASAKSGKPFFLYFPLTAPHNPIAPAAQFQGKSGLNRYADFILEVDSVVGGILRALDESGAAENTILVFTSDNGVTTLSDIPFLVSHGHHSSYIFRSHKASIYDGGHRIPCMIQWPAQLKPARISQTICLNDFITTFGELTGYKFSDTEAEDSYSLMPLLFPRDGAAYKRESVIHHSVDGSFALRKGKWKLICVPGDGIDKKIDFDFAKRAPDSSFQLYDMETDIGETRNLRAENPKIAAELKQLLIQYIEQGRSTPGAKQSNDVPYPDRYMQWRKYD